MAEQGGGLSQQETELYRLWVEERLTQAQLAAHFGVTQPAISARLKIIRGKLPSVEDRLAETQLKLFELYEDSIRRLTELANMEGAPVTVGKNGDILYDPEIKRDGEGAVVRDYSGRMQAIKLAGEQARELRKMLGIDAAEKVELSGSVRYELVGIDPEDLK